MYEVINQESQQKKLEQQLQLLEELCGQQNFKSNLEIQIQALQLAHPLNFKYINEQQTAKLYFIIEYILICQIRIYEEEINQEKLKINLEALFSINPNSYIVLANKLQDIYRLIQRKAILKQKNNLEVEKAKILIEFQRISTLRNFTLIQEKEEYIMLLQSLEEFKKQEYQNQRDKSLASKLMKEVMQMKYLLSRMSMIISILLMGICSFYYLF